MVFVGILLGGALGLLQLFLLRRGARSTWSSGRRLLFFLARYLLWAAALAGGARTSLPTLLSLVASALVVLVGGQAILGYRARKERS